MKRMMIGRFLLIFAFAGLVVLVIVNFTSTRQFFQTLAQGNWLWVGAAIVSHLVYFVVYAVLYKIAFMLVGVSSRTRHLVQVLFASFFLDAVAPLGGAAGAALFVDDAERRGESGTKTALGMLVVLFLDLSTMIPFIAVALVFMAQEKVASPYYYLGAAFYIAYVALLALALAVSRANPERVLRGFEFIRSIINGIGSWVKHPRIVDERWPRRNALQFSVAAKAAAARPGLLALSFCLAMALHFINMAGLALVFLAFGQPVDWRIVTAGFGMSTVFFVITVFQGVAIVEVVLTLLFASVGMPRETAVVIAVVYRGLNFWMPIAIGILFSHAIVKFGSRPADLQSARRP